MIVTANRLLHTISQSTSPFHTALEAKRQLKEAGFQELSWNSEWCLKPGNKYYIAPFDTTLFAFKINSNFCKTDLIKIATSHIDNPGLRIKANPEHFQGNYQKVNTEIYGGAILNTWFDRPLSIAGRVFMKGKSVTAPQMELVDFQRPLLMIPNLSIHMNRTVNDGIALNKQIDMLPIAGISSEKDKDQHFITNLVANEL
jgi:aspartyl aminopeptidase